MKFGLNFISTCRATDVSAADYFTQTLRLCEAADDQGFTSVKTVEHYFHEYGGYSPNPVVLLAAIAARTRRLRLVTGAVIPAFNNPIKLAGELAMLDNISQGRLDVGFGRAFIPQEFAAFHVPMDESRERFEEGIRVIEHLWREDQLDFDGQFYHLHGIHSLPKPFQQPHPPIWIAAISSEESVAWAGRHGYNLLIVSSVGGLERTGAFVKAYRQAWREGGYKPGAEQIQVVLQCYMAETHDEAVEGFKQPRTTCMDVFKEATQSWAGISSSSYPGYSRMVSAFSAQTWQTSLEDRTALVGSPEEVAAQVRHLQKIYGDVELSLEITFGNLSEAEAFRTLKLFSAYVMPLF